MTLGYSCFRRARGLHQLFERAIGALLQQRDGRVAARLSSSDSSIGHGSSVRMASVADGQMHHDVRRGGRASRRSSGGHSCRVHVRSCSRSGKLVACGSIPTCVHHEHGDRLAATGGNPGCAVKAKLASPLRRGAAVGVVFRRSSIPANVALFQAGTSHHEPHPPPRACARHSFRRQLGAARPRAAELAAAAAPHPGRHLAGRQPRHHRAAARRQDGGPARPDHHGREQHRRRRRHRRQHGVACAAGRHQHDPADGGLCQRRRGRKISVRRRQHLRLPQHGLRLSVRLSGAEGFADQVVRRHAGARQGQSRQAHLRRSPRSARSIT